MNFTKSFYGTYCNDNMARSHPLPEARGSGQEEQPHLQGAVAAWAQEGLEEPSHVESQEPQR